ncbi:MAG: type II and III secretion system protein [Kiritimatiellaeota bacterium]|nr:type II and III secretion system protein [Kiritimatiellota bacterium]
MRLIGIPFIAVFCCGVLCAQDEIDDDLPEGGDAPVTRADYTQLLEKFVSEAGEELVIHTVRCKHVNAETLRRLVENFLSPGGTVACSDEDDILVVSDTETRLEQIKKIIEDADQPVPQVLVEARIVEFEISDDFTKEVELGFANVGDSDSLRRMFTSLVLPASAAMEGTVKDTDAAAGASSSGRIWAFGGNDSFKMWSLVRYLQTKNYARLLASPNIVIRRGSDGNIITGEQVPIPAETTTGSSISKFVEYRDIGVKLIVRPLMVVEDRIRLRINPEFSSITRYDVDSKAPYFALRSASTELETRSGDMIVLGGLLRKEERITETRVPYLSNIPLLGWFFRGKDTRSVTSQLVIFMTPYLITPENAAVRDATQSGKIPDTLRNKIIEIERQVNDVDAQPWKDLKQDNAK